MQHTSWWWPSPWSSDSLSDERSIASNALHFHFRKQDLTRSLACMYVSVRCTTVSNGFDFATRLYEKKNLVAYVAVRVKICFSTIGKNWKCEKSFSVSSLFLLRFDSRFACITNVSIESEIRILFAFCTANSRKIVWKDVQKKIWSHVSKCFSISVFLPLGLLKIVLRGSLIIIWNTQDNPATSNMRLTRKSQKVTSSFKSSSEDCVRAVYNKKTSGN